MKTTRRVLPLISVLLALTLSCSLFTREKQTAPTEVSVEEEKTPTATVEMTPLVPMDEEDEALPPKILATTPQGGQVIPVDAAMEVLFNQEMDQDATESAWRLLDSEGEAVPGSFDWPQPDALTFSPDQPLDQAETYTAILATSAQSAQGVSLQEEVRFSVNTLESVKVEQVFPADGSFDIEKMSVITVVFNHPVVPLKMAEEQASLPDPLTLEPEVAGYGEWVNTSVYVFHPDEQLKSATTYTATVPAGLSDINATSLQSDYTWAFTTAMPTVSSLELVDLVYNPEDNYRDVPLDQVFAINFNQPMDQEATQAAFSLSTQGGVPIEVEFDWDEDSTTMTATPVEGLTLESDYLLSLDAAAKDTNGSPLAEGIDWHFSTYSNPGIHDTFPGHNSQQPSYSGRVTIWFKSPMTLESLEGKVIISPDPPGGAQWTYNQWDWSYNYYGLEPATTYTVRVLPGMEDIYGNPITQEYRFQFTTGWYSPTAYLEMPYGPAIYSVGDPQTFYMRHVNIDYAEIGIYRLSTAKFAAFVSGEEYTYEYEPPEDTLVHHWRVESQAAYNDYTLTELNLATADGEPLPQGLYFLKLMGWRNGGFSDDRLVMVADSNLTLKTTRTEALGWMTDLSTGAPISGAAVTVYDQEFQRVGQGATDDDGLVQLELPAAENAYDARFAVVDDGEHFALASSDWSSGVSPYDFGVWSDYYKLPDEPTTYVYTDRPLYRPGHPVSFKGIVRLDDDLAYHLPERTRVSVRISSYEEVVYEEELPLTEFGSFSGQLLLDENAALGQYTIDVRFPDQDTGIGSGYFSVAEYRKPEFQVQVSADRTEALPGEEFTFTVAADYFSGGAVADADVTWTLSASPYRFDPGGPFSRYRFDDLERDLYYYDYFRDTQDTEIIASDEATTDENGEVTVTLPAALSEEGRGQALTFEATITDLAGNDVSGRTDVNVHQSSVYVGVRPQRYVGSDREEQVFELVTVDWDAATVADQSVDVTIVERRWNSVQVQEADGSIHWESSVEEIPVAEFEDVRTDSQGRASVSFMPPNGGVFKAIATTRDPDGNQAKAAAYMWVSSSDYVAWRQTDDRKLNLILDKDTYEPGETAEILITSPFQGSVYALVTVERGSIRFSDVIRLASNSATYELPISADMAPNVFVSVTIIQGGAGEKLSDFRTGMVEIQVTTEQQALDVDLSVDQEQAGPGDEVTYTVTTRDYAGEPVSAEVSLALTDLATLTLMGPNAEPILEYFYSPQSLSVRTAMPLVYNIEHYNENIQEQIAPGGGMGSGGGGLGKGFDVFGVEDVREDFPDTAYWVADIVTDENGEATVTVNLPDNLTTWRMDGRAATVDTRVGQTIIDLVSTKPLLVRPQTPRFFVIEDQARLGAAVHNNSDDDLSVDVSLMAQGVTVQDEQTQQMEIPAGQQAFVTWDVLVDADAERVDLIFNAEGGGYSDASRPPLATLDDGGIPVYRYQAPETVGTAGMLTEGGASSEGISLPTTEAELTDGNLTVEIDSSLTAAMADGLTYLEHYPYSCVEQTVSRFLPNVLTTQALKAAGRRDAELEANLRDQVNVALQRLYNWQNPDGGWGWWADLKSNDLVTAYTVLGLVEAKRAGYTVSDDVIERSLVYLRDHLESLEGLDADYKLNRQAFKLYVLAQADQRWIVSRTVTLYEQHESLSLYARALLAQTFYKINPEDARLDTLISDIVNAADMSATGTHWEEGWRDYWNWNTDIRTTAIVLGALTEIDPENSLNANAVRWLMTHRTAGHWHTTQETAWSLMALANWITATGELNPDYQYSVYLNAEHLGSGVADQETLGETFELRVDVEDLLADEINRLTIGRDEGPGSLYYTAHLTASLPVEELDSLDRGIVVSRSYFYPEENETPVTLAQQGDMLMARLTVVVPSSRRYVIIDDPLPAGLEAIDQSLETSPQESIPDNFTYDDIRSSGWGWWYFDHTELRDEKVVISANYLPAGTYVYTYMVRASTPGDYHVIPPTAQEFYFPEVYGRGEGSMFTVAP